MVLLFGTDTWVMTPPHEPVPCGVQTQGSAMYHWEADFEIIGRELGLSTSGDGDVGGGV